MGSGTKRKENDQPLIKRPQTLIDSISNGTGGNYASKSESTPNICPVSFQIKLDTSVTALNGVKVHLVKFNDLYQVEFMGSQLGVLNKKQSAIVTICGEMGIKYTGEVVLIKEDHYARFFRIA